MGNYRKLEVRNSRPLQMRPVEVTGDTVASTSGQRLAAGAGTCVLPRVRSGLFGAYGDLAERRCARNRFGEPSPARIAICRRRAILAMSIAISSTAICSQVSRQHARTAEFLLNPWAIRSTETGEQVAKTGEAFGGTRAAVRRHPLRRVNPRFSANATDFSNVDFLADSQSSWPTSCRIKMVWSS